MLLGTKYACLRYFIETKEKNTYWAHMTRD